MVKPCQGSHMDQPSSCSSCILFHSPQANKLVARIKLYLSVAYPNFSQELVNLYEERLELMREGVGPTTVHQEILHLIDFAFLSLQRLKETFVLNNHDSHVT